MKAIIFDMDGVLVDSVPVNWKLFNKALSRWNVSFSDDHFRQTLGRSLQGAFEYWREHFGLPESLTYPDFQAALYELQEDVYHEYFRPETDVLSFIDSLKADGFRIAVGTSSHGERAREILSLIGVLDKVDALITSDDVTAHKPEPDVFLACAEQLGVEPAECIVFEDAHNGIEAAKNALMHVIGKRFSVNDDVVLKDADSVISHFSELSIEKLNAILDTK
ncbi:MAG: HAD family hydrolase [Candidatus Woesearchaeota archaeon]